MGVRQILRDMANIFSLQRKLFDPGDAVSACGVSKDFKIIFIEKSSKLAVVTLVNRPENALKLSSFAF